jgi:hypothetical protein
LSRMSSPVRAMKSAFTGARYFARGRRSLIATAT